jgi:CRISPR-associated endonuclease/helicase Cas3
VLLIKAYRHHPDKQATEITLLNDKKHMLPKNLKFYDKPQWRELAALLIQNTVQVADYLAPEKLSIKELEWLRHYFYLGNPEFGESLLRVALVSEADEIKRLMGGNALENYELSYTSSYGYKASK